MRTVGETEAAISPRLRDLLGVRLARLPGDCLTVLRVAAAAGRSVDARLLARVSGMRHIDVERAIRTAVDEQILVRAPDDAAPGYRFRHEIMRTMVESRLLPDEAARIHGRYAQALGADPATRPDPAVMAYHWDAAGDARRALTAHVEAGLAAEAAYAFAEALLHLERAVALWAAVDDAEAHAGLPRFVVVQHAAGAAARSGDYERAIALTREIDRVRTAGGLGLVRGGSLEPALVPLGNQASTRQRSRRPGRPSRRWVTGAVGERMPWPTSPAWSSASGASSRPWLMRPTRWPSLASSAPSRRSSSRAASSDGAWSTKAGSTMASTASGARSQPPTSSTHSTASRPH